MTVLEWDKVGDRKFQTGVDRGVLHPFGGVLWPWNGLISVEMGSNSELKSYYMDGIKILENVTPGDFVGKLHAFTYPDAFNFCLGVNEIYAGLSLYEQPPVPFNLSYRTKLGNDAEGEDLGYKLHLLYNLRAIPESETFNSIGESLEPSSFSWSLTGTPDQVSGYRPTCHISIDSTRVDPTTLASLEHDLYGLGAAAPYFPSIHDVRVILGELGGLTIIDNGDGTWTANDPSDDFITLSLPNEFAIDGANVVWLDSDTYQISNTDPPMG